MEQRAPRRGEVWRVQLDPVRGHEQGRSRPAVVVSSDAFNAGQAGLVVVCPLTTRARGIRLHLPVLPPEGGLRHPSVVLCDQVRAISKLRLVARLGSLTTPSMAAIDDRIRVILDL